MPSELGRRGIRAFPRVEVVPIFERPLNSIFSAQDRVGADDLDSASPVRTQPRQQHPPEAISATETRAARRFPLEYGKLMPVLADPSIRIRVSCMLSPPDTSDAHSSHDTAATGRTSSAIAALNFSGCAGCLADRPRRFRSAERDPDELAQRDAASDAHQPSKPFALHLHLPGRVRWRTDGAQLFQSPAIPATRRFGEHERIRCRLGSDAERRDAADLALKGLVCCILGLLFPPFVLVGLVPLFYGGRKLVYTSMGLGPVDDADSPEACECLGPGPCPRRSAATWALVLAGGLGLYVAGLFAPVGGTRWP